MGYFSCIASSSSTFKFDSRVRRSLRDLNQWHLDDPDMETEAEALNGEATDSRRMEVQIGGAVTLECDGGCWGHGPGMDPVGGPGPLALSRVVYQEAGEYRCVAPDRKMQDTWRAQLPYHIKVTGESDKISTRIDCQVPDVCTARFLPFTSFVYISGARIRVWSLKAMIFFCPRARKPNAIEII